MILIHQQHIISRGAPGCVVLSMLGIAMLLKSRS
jgi:hypothetical protein